MTREAATTAVVIARQEQERGSYTVARNVLLAMYQVLVIFIYGLNSDSTATT